MRGGDLLFDANALIGWIAGVASIRTLVAGESPLQVPAIVVGELRYGALNSSRVSENLARLSAALADFRIPPVDEATCVHYAEIRMALKTRGRPISENDLWIAAVAMQYSLTLLTSDQDFNAIEGLPTLDW